MELKSILLALASGPSAQVAVEAATIVAKAQQAHLVGLHVVDVTPFARYIDAEVPVQILEVQRERLLAEAAELETTFKRICAEAGIDSQWHCVEGSTQHVIDLNARYCDLVCVSAPTSIGDGLASQPLGEELIFSTGRPVLMIPEGFDAKSIGDHVMVAWNGSREAAKAISHALPILSRAQKVSMVTVVGKHVDDAQAGVIAADMSRYLARHGVDADAQTADAGSVPAGQFLHEWARGQNADLLVMGAYGHARIREFILGGVTHWSLRNSTIPVLMAH